MMKYVSILLLALPIICKSQPGYPESTAIMQQLKIEKDDKMKAALILQVANFSEHDLPDSERKYLVETLLEWYRNNENPWVHSAIDRLFRHSSTGKILRKIDWDLSSILDEIDRELLKKGKKATQWFLTPQLHTMSIIRGPVTFSMGSPLDERYRTDDELPHRVTIPRTFAISTKEVTVSQFQKFLEDNPLIKQAARQDSSKFPSIENEKLLVFSPEGECPQVYVTWYEAAQYCNWLSKLAGIPEREWCYPTNKIIKSGMMLPKDYLKRQGYRLPTEAEWEYAARAGTTTSRFYGKSDELLSEYAWYSKNPPKKKSDPNDPNDPQHTYPVGQLKPNTYGLFDVYGNVWEWCDSRRQPYGIDNITDELATHILITDSVAMVRRGGSFSYGKDVMRSAHRGALNYFPNQRRDNVGFRIARTIND